MNSPDLLIQSLFDQFTKELRFIHNRSNKTLDIYNEAFRKWMSFVGQVPTEDNLFQFIIGMREANLSITSCNIYIGSINSFLSWLKDKGHCQQKFTNGKDFKLIKLPQQKKQLKVFDDSEIHKILSFKPKSRNENRIYSLVCLLIDTGMRINEALQLELSKVDFDKLIITVKGKGNKERVIPMSLELRKILFRYATNWRKSKFPSPIFFCTFNGTHLSYRSALRSFDSMLSKVGVSKDSIDHCFHSFRRKFAKAYIKNGGNIAYLQQAMGHSTLAMTKHYIGDIPIEDLQRMHNTTSLLGRLK